jgi:capsule polysaccharide export protein KpsC/LpsZ
MTEATTIIINSILGAVGTAIFAGVCVWVKGLWLKSKNYDKAVKALAHDAYFRYCRYLLPEDTLTEEEVENMNYLYDSYHSLGLNSTGDKLYQQIMSKPVSNDK